jgi:hypothetical protein
VPDVRDFLGFLRDREEGVVKVELGVPSDDLEHHDRPMPKLYGVLGPFRMVDDEDRVERGVAWVPIGAQQPGSVGFWIEADRVSDVIINPHGGKARFVDGHYIAVAPDG